jgi:spore maturation protein CgeB
VPFEERFRSDLSLFANRRSDRERRMDEFFFRAAELSPSASFVLAGSGWDDRPMPPNVRAVGHVDTSDHNARNVSARCVLNVTRDNMAANGWTPSARVFEAAGAGACVVTDAWEGIDVFLDPGREILVANDGEDVARILRDLDPVRAKTIGAAARSRILAHHTYAQRARLVDSILVTNAPPIEAAQ